MTPGRYGIQIIEPPTKALACDYAEALDSAQKIEALGYKLLLPGHGEPVRVERGSE